MQPTLMLQPENSNLCGQTCVAMAAGVSLDRAIEAIGHKSISGTNTRDLVRGLRALGLPCADRCRVLGRLKPVLPRRGMLVVGTKKYGHWMLTWDGVIYDPGGMWPDGYAGWKISSYLEIYS